jgi:2-dehydropantoate 2-reductase
MKICIVGAGAIGGFVGTRLAMAGTCEVSVLARGATLAAIRDQGLQLNQCGQLHQVRVKASEHAAELGAQDLVIVAVKGQALPAVAPAVAQLLGPDTLVMPAMNGVPWWFVQGVEGIGHEPLQSVDPGGVTGQWIDSGRVVGCVVHASCSTSAPGVVQHKMGQGLVLGEARGGQSERVQRVADLLGAAGFDATHSADIRYDIWYKLWGNMTMNPVSAITGATIDQVLSDPLVRAFCSAAMAEAAAIGERIGCAIGQSVEDRHAITAKLGAFKTSMLQDAEAGRAIELDAIVGAVHEISQRLQLPTPNIATLLGLTRLFGRTHGLYPKAQ